MPAHQHPLAPQVDFISIPLSTGKSGPCNGTTTTSFILSHNPVPCVLQLAALPLQKDKSCPFIVKSGDLTSNTTVINVEWPIPKNMTKAAWYASILVQCQNGSDVAWCQTDSTKNATYFGTNIINSTPTGMVIATAVCSAIGPLFLAAYFLKDFLSKGKQ